MLVTSHAKRWFVWSVEFFYFRHSFFDIIGRHFKAFESETMPQLFRHGRDPFDKLFRFVLNKTALSKEWLKQMSTDLTRIFYITFWILNKSYFDWPLTKIVCSIDSGLFFWNWFVSILSFFRFSEVINQKCIRRRSNHYLSVWPKKTDWQTERRNKDWR